MLDKLDIAFLNGFRQRVLGGIKLQLIELCGASYGVNRIIEKVAGAGVDLSDRPVIAADIVAGLKGAVRPGGVGVNQLVAVKQTIDRAAKGRVSLGVARFRVNLISLYTELLQNIAEMDRGGLAALNGDGLRLLRYIAFAWKLGHGIGARKKLLADRAAVVGLYRLIDAASFDVERDT